MGGQNGYDPVEEPFQGGGNNGLDVSGDRIRAIGAANRCGFSFIIGLLAIIIGFGDRLPSPGTGSLTDFPAIEAYQPHEGLRAKDDRTNVPKESEPCHDAHEVDQNNGSKPYITRTISPPGVSSSKSS